MDKNLMSLLTLVLISFLPLTGFQDMSVKAGSAFPFVIHSQPLSDTMGTFQDCKAYLKNDSLVIENAMIKRVYLFNNGNLITKSILNKNSGTQWKSLSVHPDFSFPGAEMVSSNATFRVRASQGTPQNAAHLQVEIISDLNGLQMKRVFRIYPHTPAIACDYFFRGDASAWEKQSEKSHKADRNFRENEVVMDQLSLNGKNWKLKSVEFYDSTDRNTTLIQEYDRVAYRSELFLRGNILFMQEFPSREGIFWLKEAPVSNFQLYYPGYDFLIKLQDFKAVGLGLAPQDVSADEWVRGYSFVTGLSTGGEEGARVALRTYQQNVKPIRTEVDNMIVLNTWGDRGRDENINEKFILNELTLGAKLGITHMQLDDGWQIGKSGASVTPGGSLANIWRNEDYWKLDPKKFPNGFEKITDAAGKAGIAVSTWFNPSIDSSFKYWRKDAAVMIEQYRKHGIYMWKIDGVVIADKQAEINFRKMLDTVVARTGGKAIFNLDVTAGKRFGYNYFYEYGTLFLENRYTDIGNYYPHSTLRNLWMLSKYIPPQRLQIEFLNKWRNEDKYPQDDPFAPKSYSFDYLFAITMPAQPLAWMEARNLPEEAYSTSSLISTYKNHWHEWHRGQIFPIGEEPSGISWTGFQSVLEDSTSGYVLIFRELNDIKEKTLEIKGIPPGSYSFHLIAGEGADFRTRTGVNQAVKFSLPKQRSFAFYRYEKSR